MAEDDIANKNLDLDNASSTPRYLIITYVAEADTLAGLAVGTVSVGSFDVTSQFFHGRGLKGSGNSESDSSTHEFGGSIGFWNR